MEVSILTHGQRLAHKNYFVGRRLRNFEQLKGNSRCLKTFAKKGVTFRRICVAWGTLGGESGNAPSRGHFAGLSARAKTTEKGKCRFACPSDEQRCSILEFCMPSG